MRNFLTIICLALTVCFSCANNAQAQSQSSSVTLYSDVPNKTAAQRQADTLANAATKSQTRSIPGYFDNVAVQVELNRISGTAAGKVYLRGSINGTSYEKFDSLTVANVAQQTKIFNVAPSKYTFYQIQFVGTGTQSVAFKSVALPRKR